MKKLMLILLCTFTSALFVSVNATGVKSGFSNYEITALDELHFGKEIQKVWTITYGNDEVPVTVVKRKSSEGMEYVVYSKFFEVSYASTAEGFGAKEVKKSWRSIPSKITKAVINQEELKKQKLISPEKVGDEYAVGLIAGFLPDLINDGYEHILN